jgi:hypothetical protein
MAGPTFLQSLAATAADFLGFVGVSIGDLATRKALVRDLGGDPTGVTGAAAFPADTLAAVKAFADSADTSAEDRAEVIVNILEILDAVAKNIEVWADAFEADGGGGAVVEELAHSLLDLLMLNWMRLNHPRVYFVAQLGSALAEVGSRYGAGSGETMRILDSAAALGRFLWSPGRSLSDFDPDDDAEGAGDLVVDLGFRAIAVLFAVLEMGNHRVDLIDEFLYGWDGPGLDIDSELTPTRADIISSKMTSFSITHRGDRPASSPSDDETVEVTLSYIPKAQGGRGFFVGLGGSLDFEAPVGDRWDYSLKVRADSAVTALILHDDFLVASIDGTSPVDSNDLIMSAAVTSRADASGLSFAIPGPTGTRLEIAQLAIVVGADKNAVETRVQLINAALVIDSSDSDGLIRELLGGSPLRLPFNVALGYSSSRGLILEGSVPPSGAQTTPAAQNSPLAGDGTIGPPIIAATIPLGRRYGPVTLHEVAMRLSRGTPDAPDAESDRVIVEADVSFSAQLGPAYLRLDRLGLGLVIDGDLPPAERNLGFIDAHLSVNPPLGIAVSIDSEIITGGGTLIHDPEQGTYFGALVLKFDSGMTLKAIGLVATRNPDGSDGSSMIVIATLEDLGITVGSLNIDGLGVLVAINRTFDENAVRAALPTGELRNVLFPKDPLHHTTEIMRSLSTFFPARRGAHMVGLMAKLSFGTPAIVHLDLALIYAWGAHKRLIVLGRMSSILPDELGILRLNLDSFGVIDFSDGTVSVDAVLVDSKLCDRFVLSGSAALRGGSGVGGFALAVGGLHPSFPLPAGFPSLSRITLALTTGDNPKVICQAYFAITSNTVQFGASAYLYAAACGFSVEGSIGFDVLIQLLPFHYLAEFRASVQLKRGSHNLFKVNVEGALEGPLPLRVRGKASFEILWCDFSVHFDKTLVGGSTPSEVPGIDVLAVLLAALGNGRNWTAQAPGAARQQVSIRADSRAADMVLLHPMGALSVRQGVVPLNLSRDIDRVGVAAPSGPRRFAVTRVRLGADEQTTSSLRDLFAPAQYFDMSDDDKLAAPSFEEMDAGVQFGDDDYLFDMASRAKSPFDYTDIAIGEDGTTTVEPEPHRLDGALVLVMVNVGAAARAPIRRTLSARFQASTLPETPRLRAAGWVAVDADRDAPSAATQTWIEARARLDAPDPSARRVLVSQTELQS